MPRDDVARTEGDLLCLAEVVVNIAIQFEPTNVPNRHQVLGPNLGGIQNVKVEAVLVFLCNDLDAEFPHGEALVRDSFIEVLAVEVRILSSKLECLVPHQGMNSEFWF